MEQETGDLKVTDKEEWLQEQREIINTNTSGALGTVTLLREITVDIAG
jgi:hypothetical protein